ncbi:MAG: ribose-phosphate diphosphokinase [Gammaproteobacteria bacterium]|nr:ribose-phosphate diphosphokinase [Gammaproteobacteria bacterium]
MSANLSSSTRSSTPVPIVFELQPQPLTAPLAAALNGQAGKLESRLFPDGESYLRITSAVYGRPCLIVAELSHPNGKYLPLIFLAATLREFGATSVGLVAPYLSYMRQDIRFQDGEVVTSKIFARKLSRQFDWLVTVDPHLHRYNSLDEIYSMPTQMVHGAPALAQRLGQMPDLLLVGPDAESEQWVAEIAQLSGHPFIIGNKHRQGDRKVEIVLPPLEEYKQRTAVIIDDVISSGHTILQCLQQLQANGMKRVQCAAVHGIFADGADEKLMAAGLDALITTNTIAHSSNAADVTPLLVKPVTDFLHRQGSAASR